MPKIPTQLPGFKDPVHDAQRTFLALLNANARPGRSYPIQSVTIAPPGLNPACAATCLTLLDLEVQVWLQPSFDPQVKNWLLFHTGCRFTEHPWEADFAVIQDLAVLTELSIFRGGTEEQPETSTTLLVQVESLEGGQKVELRGPGILDKQNIALKLPEHFWQFWKSSHQTYPLGIDIFFLNQNLVMGLPRTVKLTDLESGLTQSPP
jgi:alpha-D-ribose 1-methylphosphonate 5-triphosphate synthase subunit PhnH